MKTTGELIERNAHHYPDQCAIAMDGGRRVSYREYADRSRRLASALHRLGLRRQDRVGCLSTNSLEYMEVYGACEWAGFIAAQYNFRLQVPEVEHLLRDSSPKAVFFDAQFAHILDALRGKFPEIAHYICMAGPVPDWAVAFEDVVAQGDPAGPPIRSIPSDHAYLFYTSGTTGKPKGVTWSQRAALETARVQGRILGGNLRVLQITPLFHVGGKGFPLGAMWVAGSTVLQSAFDPLKFLEVVQRERITYTFMVAPMIQGVIEHPDFRKYDLSSLTQIMSASAPIPVPLLKRALEAFGPVFFISYGSTEGGYIAHLERHELRPDGTPEEIKRLSSVGHFIPETDAAILDDDGNPCPANVVGEVCVKSWAFEGYWNNSIATIEATRSGRFHTGDMGYADEEGYVYLVDRKKDMIISGGENIYSREVEDALYRHPAIGDVAVIGVPDPKWVEAVKAIATLKPGAQVTEAELIAFSQTQIARYKCPKSVDIVVELPRLATGKIDKVTLRKKYVA